MLIKITSRFNSEKVIYEGDADTLKDLLVKAADEGVNLTDADLAGVNLTDADLTGVNLRGVSLTGAKIDGVSLRGADLRGVKIDGEEVTKEPLMIKGPYYWVLITERYMRIGCKRYTHQEWSEFKDPTIAAMDSEALEFWNEWKEPLMMMCNKHGEIK